MFHRNAHITFPCVFHTSSANRNPIEERPSEKPFRAHALKLSEPVFGYAASRRAVPGYVCVALSHRSAAVWTGTINGLCTISSLYTYIFKNLDAQNSIPSRSTAGRYEKYSLSLFQWIIHPEMRSPFPRRGSLCRCKHCMNRRRC